MRLTQLQRQIEQKVQALPGVQSASFSMFTQGEWSGPLTMQGIAPNNTNTEDVLYNVIGTQYLQTVSIPSLAGRNFTAQVESSIATQRLIGWLSAIFAGLAVFLAAIGTYGLIAYSVARRTNEIGIRVALGAQTPALLWMVLRQSLVLLSAGLVIGVPVALGIAHGLASVLKDQLFHVSPIDPFVFITACLVVSMMTIAAAWIPARRAAKIDPLTALRCE